jgi:hypothetical protein
MLGALYRYLREADPRWFQPMNANFGLLDELPPADRVRDKREKRERLAARALAEMRSWANQLSADPHPLSLLRNDASSRHPERSEGSGSGAPWPDPSLRSG